MGYTARTARICVSGQAWGHAQGLRPVQPRLTQFRTPGLALVVRPDRPRARAPVPSLLPDHARRSSSHNFPSAALMILPTIKSGSIVLATTVTRRPSPRPSQQLGGGEWNGFSGRACRVRCDRPRRFWDRPRRACHASRDRASHHDRDLCCDPASRCDQASAHARRVDRPRPFRP